MLNQAKDNIDDYMTRMDEISSELIFNPDIDNMLYQNRIEEGSPDVFNFYKLSRNLQQNTKNSPYFSGNFYVIFKNCNMVFSHDSTYDSLEYFYDNVFNYNDTDYNTWYSNLFSGGFSRKLIPTKKVILNGTQTSAITYLYSMPFSNTSSTSLGVIEFVIEEKQLHDLLDKANINSKGWIGILDEDGKIITKDSKNNYYSSNLFHDFTDSNGYFYKKINGKDMMVLYIKSSYNHWIYTAILPTDVILMDTRDIQKTSVVIILLSFIVGILFSFFMAYQNTKPIKKVASVVRQYFDGSAVSSTSEKVNEFDYIEGSIHHIIQDSKTLEDDLKKNLLVLQSVFMENVLKDGFKDEAIMKSQMINAKLDIKGILFAVLIIYAQTESFYVSLKLPETNMVQLAIKGILLESYGSDYYVSDIGDFKYAVLLIFQSGSELENKLRITKTMEDIAKLMSSNYHMEVSFGIGKPCKTLSDVNTSFAEALRAMALCEELGNGGQAVWYESLNNTAIGYFYPLDLEIKLFNACKTGNKNEVLKILQKIYHSNFVQHELTAQAKKLLFYNMQCTLMKLTQEVHTVQDLSASLNEIDWMKNSNEVFSKIENQFVSICRMINGSKKSHNVLLRDSIILFLSAHYADSNLGVEMIANNFHLSTSYFSQFFKEQTGETFSSYLENLRIREACLIMEQKDVAIEDLASQVGYNNVYSFRRSFKKIIGVTPLSYKQNANSERGS